MDTTEPTKTFLERLQYVQGELRAIAQSDELRRLIQNEYANYDPDLTIIDAIHAVTEVVDAYEQNYCVLHLQAGQTTEPQSFTTFDIDDLGIPFC
jgi:hypothetical protein